MLDHPRTQLQVIAGTAVAAAIGFWLSLTSPGLPGSEQLTLEDAVDVAALLTFAVLGAVLLRRRRAPGLGTALVALGVMIGLDYLLGGLADAIADGRADPPAPARVCNLASEATFVVAFFLLALAPNLLFPTGRLPSRRWRPVAWIVGAGIVAAVLSVLLKPGPVDEDVPAWGDNPLGIAGTTGAVDVLEIVALVLLAVSLGAGLVALVTRWIRYRGPRRRQLAWFSLAVGVQVVGLVVDTSGKNLLLEVLLALTIFGGLLWGIGWPLLGPLGRLAEEHDAAATAARGVETAPVS